MSMRLFVLLFTALFLIGALPVFFLQPFGSASAGVTAGFMLPVDDLYHATVTIAIGVLSAWLGQEAILFLPLCTLLILCIGSLTEIDEHAFPAVHAFVIGAILLFSLCVSMLRNKSFLLCILPIALWAYFVSTGYMHNVPSITTPLFFLIGIIVSSALLIAIGIALGITLTDKLKESFTSLKSSAAFTTFLSLF